MRSQAGALVPLSAFSHYEPTSTALAVNHQGQFPAVTLSFNLAPESRWARRWTAIDRATQQLGLPASIQAASREPRRPFSPRWPTSPC